MRGLVVFGLELVASLLLVPASFVALTSLTSGYDYEPYGIRFGETFWLPAMAGSLCCHGAASHQDRGGGEQQQPVPWPHSRSAPSARATPCYHRPRSRRDAQECSRRMLCLRD